MKHPFSRPCAALLFALLVMFSGCGKDSSAAWLSDYTQAEEAARTQQKNILLLFSGDDWDGASQMLKEAVLGTKQFCSAAAKKYVLVNVDFSQQEYARTELSDDASEDDIAEAMRIQQLYIEKEELAQKYNLAAYPSLYVLSKEGYALASVALDPEVETAESLLQKLKETEETQASLGALILALDGTQGTDRVRAIDALYEATDIELRNPLSVFAEEVVSLDPGNTTGVIGKYEYELANQRAMDHAMYEGDVVAAAREFEEVGRTGHLNAEEKQNAYYMSAYILAMDPAPDFDKMLELLDASYSADPDSELAAQILGVIENIRQVRSEQE